MIQQLFEELGSEELRNTHHFISKSNIQKIWRQEFILNFVLLMAECEN